MPEVLQYNDYDPFGMLTPNRHGGEDYRYSFNGMEKDDEIKGDGNSYTTEFREYDPRYARWLTVDPKTHHEYSPYSAFDNNPIYYIDPEGADSEGENKPDLNEKTAEVETPKVESNVSSPPPGDKQKTLKDLKINTSDTIQKQLETLVKNLDEGESLGSDIISLINPDAARLVNGGKRISTTEFEIDVKGGVIVPDGSMTVKLTSVEISKKIDGHYKKVKVFAVEVNISIIGFKKKGYIVNNDMWGTKPNGKFEIIHKLK